MKKLILLLFFCLSYNSSKAVDLKQLKQASLITTGAILVYYGAYQKYNSNGGVLKLLSNGLSRAGKLILSFASNNNSSGMKEYLQQIIYEFFETAGKQIQIVPNKNPNP